VTRFPAGPAVLTAKGLAIGWTGRAQRLLSSGIDLELKAGDFAALVGPNGSGKSTLLRTLAGIQAPLHGEVSLCGLDLRRLTVEDRSRRAACVFTDRYDSGFFTVFDIVAFGRYPYTDARNRLGARDLAAVDEAITAVGLGSLARSRFAELSDGERQKALIARAIAQGCPLLVLDEPTAFLDAPARVEVFHIVRDLARSSGKAVVLSTHDIDHALRYSDMLWLMDREHSFTVGAPEDLAMSGAIGQAFDGEGFRFDTGSGAFRSIEAERHYGIELEGPESDARTWTARLAERLGLVVSHKAQAGYETLAIVSIGEGEGRLMFTLHGTGEEPRSLVAANYGELARLLAELIAERDGGAS
jgi:iron complex transport system ATP-binding protein